MTDPSERLVTIRQHLAADRVKLPAVDHNGHLDPTPVAEQPADTEQATPPGFRSPLPDPSQGAGRGAVALEGTPAVPPGLTTRARIADTRASHRPNTA